MNAIDPAIAAFRRAHELKPDALHADWAARLSLPTIYQAQEEIDRTRERWAQGIKDLHEGLDLSTPAAIAAAEGAAASTTSFHLAYQGRNDLALLTQFGGLLRRIAKARYPDLPDVLPRRRLPDSERIRVGFLSSHFYAHSVYRTHGRWITRLDKRRFDVQAFHTGEVFDQSTEDIKHHSSGFQSGFKSTADLIAALRKGALDVLVYLDIGMAPKVQLPAALRLAPVQCTTWGHPVTSGLPTIDYYLSSDLMEPDDAQSHYSERLVRLPNLSSCYPRIHLPDQTSPNGDDRVDARPIRYLCSQSLYKLLPQYDGLCARIAAEVPNSQFWFIAHSSASITSQFQRRLDRAFSQYGLSADARCVIHPRTSHPEFLRLNQMTDIALDSARWSGCNSTLDAIACGLPVVTLPGAMMRGRHSYAILKMIGVDETIARNEDDYVEIAVKLAGNRPWRDDIAGNIRRTAPRAFDDSAPIRALETFFESVCRRPG